MSSTAKLRSRRYLKNVEPVMRRLAVAITGLELPAVEKISQSREEDPFQVTIATLLSARTQDATTYAASERLFKKAATPEAMGKLTVKQIEKLIYPGQLLPLQGAIHQSDVREADEGFRRQDAVDDGGAADAAGRRTQDGEPGVDSRVREPEEHLRRHARPSHREPARLGAHAGRRTKPSRRCIARRNRDGGRTSISTSSHGDRTCAGRSIHDARHAPSRTCARASA